MWINLRISFEKRGFTNIFNGTLSNESDNAIYVLKQHIAQKHGIIVRTWLNETVKEKKSYHSCSFNNWIQSNGYFFPRSIHMLHNIYMNYNNFISLWDVHGEYWLLIIEDEIQQPPTIFNNYFIIIFLLIGLFILRKRISSNK
jgi:hypothetical protein